MSRMSQWSLPLDRNGDILEARCNNDDDTVEAEPALLDFTGKMTRLKAGQRQLLHQ